MMKITYQIGRRETMIYKNPPLAEIYQRLIAAAEQLKREKAFIYPIKDLNLTVLGVYTVEEDGNDEILITDIMDGILDEKKTIFD